MRALRAELAYSLDAMGKMRQHSRRSRLEVRRNNWPGPSPHVKTHFAPHR